MQTHGLVGVKDECNICTSTEETQQRIVRPSGMRYSVLHLLIRSHFGFPNTCHMNS